MLRKYPLLARSLSLIILALYLGGLYYLFNTFLAHPSSSSLLNPARAISGASSSSSSSSSIDAISQQVVSTSDGGKTWTSIYAHHNTYLFSLHCPTVSTCLAPGYSLDFTPTKSPNDKALTLFMTTNFAKNWSSTSLKLADRSSSNSNGNRSGQPSTGATNPSSTTAASSSTAQEEEETIRDNPNEVRLSCPNSSRCYLLTQGAQGDVFGTTTDGGVSWSTVNPRVANWQLTSLNCPAELVCLAVGQDGLIMLTQDAGQHWQQPKSPTDATLSGLSCGTSGFCMAYATRTGTIITSEDAGQTWHKQTTPAPNLSGLACAGSETCYVYSSSYGASASQATSKLFVTHNRGIGWEPLDYGTKEPISALSCPDPQHCFLVMGQRRLLRATGDGGKTWVEQNPRLKASILALSCPGALNCYLLTSPGMEYFD